MIGERITVTRPGEPTGAEDSQGNPLVGPPTVIQSDGWAVAPRASDETAEPFGQQTITGLTLYRRAPFEVLPTDVFTVRGELWDVDGDSGEWVSPYTTIQAGVVVNLRRQS